LPPTTPGSTTWAAWRGGCFVLAYDDSGRVVADFTLLPLRRRPTSRARRAAAAAPPQRRPPIDVVPIKVVSRWTWWSAAWSAASSAASSTPPGKPSPPT
jgi:hypothetical protein